MLTQEKAIMETDYLDETLAGSMNVTGRDEWERFRLELLSMEPYMEAYIAVCVTAMVVVYICSNCCKTLEQARNVAG